MKTKQDATVQPHVMANIFHTSFLVFLLSTVSTAGEQTCTTGTWDGTRDQSKLSLPPVSTPAAAATAYNDNYQQPNNSSKYCTNNSSSIIIIIWPAVTCRVEQRSVSMGLLPWKQLLNMSYYRLEKVQHTYRIKTEQTKIYSMYASSKHLITLGWNYSSAWNLAHL